MLKLRKGKPPFMPVQLGENAWIRVRAATSTDVEEASARVRPIMLGFLAGAEAGPALVEVLGEDFKIDALSDNTRLSAAATRLSEIYLVLACQDGWAGVGSEDGEAIEKPDAVSIALLLADPVRRNAIMRVIEAAVHEESAEKNASPASPIGGADTPTGAPPADGTATPVPSAAVPTANSAMAASVQRSSLPRLHARAGQLLS